MNIFKELKLKDADRPFIYGWSILAAVIFLIIGFIFDIVGIAILFSLLYYLLMGLGQHVFRQVEISQKYQQQKNQSILSIHDTLKADVPLPYMTGWAAEPELIAAILKEIKFNQPEIIFEIGSGTSTILCGMLMKQIDQGHIVSIDHDERYFESNLNELKRYGVSNRVDLFHAPLLAQEIKGKTYNWYDLSKVKMPEKINLVVVDGPPLKTNHQARYPSVPLLYDYLADDAVIILDDASRKDETAIVQRWLDEYPDLKHEFIDSEKGISVLRRVKS
jgi:predicted O-methyltransferase YrrM